MSLWRAEDLAGRWVYGTDDDGADLFYDLLIAAVPPVGLKYKEEAMEGLLTRDHSVTSMRWKVFIGNLLTDDQSVGSIMLRYDLETGTISSAFQALSETAYGENRVARRQIGTSSPAELPLEEVPLPPAGEVGNWVFQVRAGVVIRARMRPDVSADFSGFELASSETFEVSEVKSGDGRLSFLRLANGLGWIPTHQPGDSRPLIAPKTDRADSEQMKVIYHCVSFLPAVLRSAPDIDAKTNSNNILPGESVIVERVVDGADGLKFLELAGGRGWAISRHPTGARRAIMVQGPRLAVASQLEGPRLAAAAKSRAHLGVGVVKAEPVAFVNTVPIEGYLLSLFLAAIKDQFKFGNCSAIYNFFRNSRMLEYEKRALVAKHKEIEGSGDKDDAIYFFVQAAGLDAETLRTERSSRVS